MTPEEQRREIARLDLVDLTKEAADRLRFQADFAQSLLKTLTVVHGGALIALFTLIGHGDEQASSVLGSSMIWYAFTSFVLGLIFTMLATFGAFYSQLHFYNSTLYQVWSRQREMLGGERDERHLEPFKKGNIAMSIGLVLAALSVLSFLAGSGFALAGVLDSLHG